MRGDWAQGAYAQVVSDTVGAQIAMVEERTRYRVEDAAIPADQTFEQWCEKLAADGLKVDGKPFSLAERPALRHIYRMVPTTREQARKSTIAIMKGAQVGMTVWEMLAMLYLAIKFEPVAIGMYVPSQPLAAHTSSHRLMPIIRRVPEAYKRLVGAETKQRAGTQPNEGNVMTRALRDSLLLMLWTSSKIATESYPLDILSFDEVQEILVATIEKVRERMSASDLALMFLLSTANWPDADIDYWYKRGTRERFHTACGCPGGVILDEVFPDCIQYNSGQIRGAPKGEWVYQCPTCKQYIPDAQAPAKIVGSPDGWVAENPQAEFRSAHVPQTLSSTVSPREMIQAFHTATDLKNFYNRKLGKPWADPSQIPITDAVLNACVQDGAAMGSAWLTGGRDCYMGIDQMGQFNVVTIKRRAADGRREVVHLEMIFDADPFARCSDLMREYGVAVCVVENLPNYNDAKRFAYKHKGRVFIASYTDMRDDMLRWGDAIVTKADRKTRDEDRDRYTVTIDQYKAMSTSMAYFVNRQQLIPPPNELEQEIQDKGQRRRSAICREFYFLHLKKTALVIEEDPETRKRRGRVVKVGLDPHFSFANMLADVAYARAHGSAGFILPTPEAEVVREQRETAVRKRLPGLPPDLMGMIQQQPEREAVCGRCTAFDPKRGYCTARSFRVQAADRACEIFVPAKD